MICWFCSNIMSLVDQGKKEQTDKLRQTEYKCHNCGALYVASEHVIHGPTKANYFKNQREEQQGGEPKDSIRP